MVSENQWKEMKDEIKSKVVSKKPILAIGSGGNINKLFSMSKTKDGKPISAFYIKKSLKETSALTIEERMVKYKLREDRADVLVPALTIFNNVLSWGGIEKMYVPKISVADGLIHHIYNKKKQEKKSKIINNKKAPSK